MDFTTVWGAFFKQSLQDEQNDLHASDYLLMKFNHFTF
jgi:hypothetical protein